MKILIVEDNTELAGNTVSYLDKEGYVTEWAENYQKAMDKLVGFAYDVVLLDLMLPDGNGLNLLQFIKKECPGTGVLIMSAKNEVNDKIAGLDQGADDYLAKPFHLSELNARVKAIFRRRQLAGTQEVTFKEITINTLTMEVHVGEQVPDLTRKEFELLLYLVVNKNRLLTKQSIAEHLWGDYMDTADSFDFVYQHIKNLRKKITAAGGQDYIHTMYGSGYRFTDKSL